jgi:anti-sigma factor RsiW
MMTCQSMSEVLFDLAAGNVPDGQRQAVDDHLKSCCSCAALVQSYQWTIALSRQLPKRELPPALHARLVRVIANHQGGPYAGGEQS